jgi:hypothetical protein
VLQADDESATFAPVNARAAIVLGLALAACGGEASQVPPAQAPAAAPPPATPALPVAPQADVDMREPGAAMVHGTTRIAFDGLEEGLAWPSLDKAFPGRKTGDVLTIQVARAVPMIHLLRAAWTLHQADLHLQAQDASGAMHAVALTARRDGAPSAPGCHLAVFLRPDGALRVASPGGPVNITGDDAAASLARSLDAERAKCPIKYVAFGAESDSAPFGPVFDVVLAVDLARSAGDARYVLGQAMHVAPAPPSGQ